MHFHLPKPLHGWREFAGEVAIIVLGVTIALGAEQVVEDVRWMHEVTRAKASLKEELAGHYTEATEMELAQPCIDRQLQTLEQAVLAPGPYRPVPLYKDSLEFTYRAPARSWPVDIWQSMVSSGVTSHFDKDLRLKLAAYYGTLDALTERRQRVDAFFSRARILARPIQPDAGTRARLGEELEQAQGDYAFIALVGNQLIYFIDQMGFAPSQRTVAQDLSTSGTLNFCRAHHLPLGKVRAAAPR